MRKIIAFENISIDSYFAGPNGELDWTTRDNEEITQYNQQGRDSVDTFLFGKITYQMMASFWPTPAAQALSPVFANILNTNHKIVFSKTLEKAEWNNTTIVKELTKDTIIDMKNQSGKNMMIFGSGSVVEQLTNMGLIDEYHLMVNPIILGKGKPLFNDIKQRLNLKLMNTKAFSNGVVLLQYQPIN